MVHTRTFQLLRPIAECPWPARCPPGNSTHAPPYRTCRSAARRRRSARCLQADCAPCRRAATSPRTCRNSSSARASRISFSSLRRRLARQAAPRATALRSGSNPRSAPAARSHIAASGTRRLLGDLENGGDIAGQMIGPHRNAGRQAEERRHRKSPVRSSEAPDPPAPRRVPDLPGTGKHRRRPSVRTPSLRPAGPPDAPPATTA